MKLCIPTHDDRGLGGTVATHFGRAPWFTLVDTNNGDVHAHGNPGCHAHPGTCHHIDQLRALGVHAVVGPSMGLRARRRLIEAGIAVFEGPPTTVSDVIDAMNAGTVRRLDASRERPHRARKHRPKHMREG